MGGLAIAVCRADRSGETAGERHRLPDGIWLVAIDNLAPWHAAQPGELALGELARRGGAGFKQCRDRIGSEAVGSNAFDSNAFGSNAVVLQAIDSKAVDAHVAGLAP